MGIENSMGPTVDFLVTFLGGSVLALISTLKLLDANGLAGRFQSM